VNLATTLSEDGTKFSSAAARNAYMTLTGKAVPESIALAKQEHVRSLESSIDWVVQRPASTVRGEAPREDAVPSCPRYRQKEALEAAPFYVGQEITHSGTGLSPQGGGQRSDCSLI
jgi:hypothetical protein